MNDKAKSEAVIADAVEQEKAMRKIDNKIKVSPGQMVTMGLPDAPLIKIDNKIKKVMMVKIDRFLLDRDEPGTYAAAYMNPATTHTITISADEKKFIVKDSDGVWLFPNNQRTKKMLAMFFDYIDPAKLMGEDKEKKQ